MQREKMVESILTFLPSMFKKLMRGALPEGISKQQLGLLFHISNEEGRTMSYYSEKMMVPKPNLTVLADKLISEEMIARAFDPGDRRVIILKITEKGQKFLCEYKTKVKAEMMRRLEFLNDDEVKRMNDIIDELKVIFDKIEQ